MTKKNKKVTQKKIVQKRRQVVKKDLKLHETWQGAVMSIVDFPEIKTSDWLPVLEKFFGRKIKSNEKVYEGCRNLIKRTKIKL